MDDDALIAAVARGDDVALRELFQRHASWLAGRLRGVLPSSPPEPCSSQCAAPARPCATEAA